MTHTLETEVLVIGGGATGTGVLRDLAMRGFKCILVEKSDLVTGTSGRYHGLLHSGARYAVNDPQAARECIEENRILRRILPHCIEDTGGFFVVTPWDDPAYVPRFIEGSRQAGIDVEEIPIGQMLAAEPRLNPRISHCFRVPDASADSFLAAEANADSARAYGAALLPYHRVTALRLDHGRIGGAVCLNLATGEEVTILADMVINASGAWAGQIAGLAGLHIAVAPGKGVLVALNHRIVHTVINRCKMPGDGDILVPSHTVAVIGTTDVQVADPDCFAIEPWEVRLLLDEGEKLVPGFKDLRMLRAWGGVRPLYQETASSESRDILRTYVLLDHSQRDGLPGMLTITGGKWTTYRKMAQDTVDLVCRLLDAQRPCRTHLEPMEPDNGGFHYLGARLAEIEKARSFGKLVCECELVTEDDVTHAISVRGARSIDDIRRDTRLGMGPCQGGFCTFRAAGILHRLRGTDVTQTNLALRDFLQERWKGLLPVLWGQQLRQERLDELIYFGLLNADHLPGPAEGPLTPQNYDQPRPEIPAALPPYQALPIVTASPPDRSVPDLLVIGCGLAGLTAAWQAARLGQRVKVIAAGRGSLYWQTGCIDVLGYHPLNAADALHSPRDGITRLIAEQPTHPYTIAGLPAIEQALQDLNDLCSADGYPLYGCVEENFLLPTALGVPRPTCLAPETMLVGDMERRDPAIIIGFEGYPDFYPGLIAANLTQFGIPASGALLDLPALRERSFVTSRVLASLFETPEFCQAVAVAVRALVQKHAKPYPRRVGFPAVLGLDQPLIVKHRLEEQLGLPVFEIPTLPPSIPGIRIQRLLVKAIQSHGGQVLDGMQAVGASTAADGRLAAIHTEAARTRRQPARAFLLATGGLLGGGLKAHYEGHVEEVICGLPVWAPAERSQWLHERFLSANPHPIYAAGLTVDPRFQPVDADGRVIYPNLFAAGAALAGGDTLRQRASDGVALVTGWLAGRRAADYR